MERIGLGDMMDELVAEGLKVDVETYVDVIEWIEKEEIREKIVHGVLYRMLREDDSNLESATKLFNEQMELRKKTIVDRQKRKTYEI
jgi:hypothetical protein